MKIRDGLYGIRVRTFIVIGSSLIALAAVGSGVALSDSQAVERTCSRAGLLCLAKACGKSQTGSQCNSKSWTYQERLNFPHRTCDGVEGPCVGKDTNFLACLNKFSEEKDAEGKCGEGCRLETRVTACPPPEPAS